MSEKKYKVLYMALVLKLLELPSFHIFMYTWKSSLLGRLTISLILITFKDTTVFSFSLLSLKM